MSTNLEYRGERQRKRESRWQTNEAQREKGDTDLEREIKKKKKTNVTFFCWKNNMKILYRR